MTGSTAHQVISAVADVRETPDTEALRGKKESQLAFGEMFLIDTIANGWAYGRCQHDGYPGYIRMEDLAPATAPPSHVVTAATTHLYRDASIKSPRRMTLGFGSRVSAVDPPQKNGFIRLENGLFAFGAHLSDLAKPQDFIPLAENLLGVPYVWGGRSGLGIDCSGLVQVTLARAGHLVARDSEEQQDSIGTDVTGQKRRRGDLVYFPGHVGIMTDENTLLHATAAHMCVVAEPLNIVTERAGDVVAARRVT